MIKLWSVHTREDKKIALKGQHFFSFTLSIKYYIVKKILSLKYCVVLLMVYDI